MDYCDIFHCLVFCCYSRQIMTSWFDWCYCHDCRSRSRLSFAIVGKFGVGDVVWQRKVNKTTSICTANAESLVSFFCL
jgi:hypothetical protein